jgi:putative FmdB family regulatory protein
MPVYIYQCDNCGVRFERQQHFNEPALIRCPECYKNSLRKVFTPVGVVYRGSGFYSTDHRAKSTSSINRSNGHTKPEKEEKSEESKEIGKSKEKNTEKSKE